MSDKKFWAGGRGRRPWSDRGPAEGRAGARLAPRARIVPAGREAPGGGAGSRRADARLWRSVRLALLMGGYSAIDVTVCDGLITLEGTVDDIPARVMAEDYCLGLPEVRDVRNRLRVAPPAALREREVGG